MDTISVWHWLFAIFIIVALGVSDIEYLATGYSRWWTIVYFISLLNIAFVWVLACGLQLIGRLRCAGERAPLQRNAAKGYVWFWPKIAAALTSKHHWLITIVEDAFGVVCAVLVLRLSLLASQPPTMMRKTPTTSPNPTKICTSRSRWLSLVFVFRFDIARILLGAERTVEPNARFEG